MSTDTQIEPTEVIVPEPEKKTVVITITPQTIEELKTLAESAKLSGVEVLDGKIYVRSREQLIADESGLKAVKTLRLRAVKARTTCAKEYYDLKEEIRKAGQEIDKEKRERIAAIEAIEKPLQDLEDAYEAEIDKMRAEKAEALYQHRRSILVSLGAEGVFLEESRIRNCNEEAFADYCNYVKAEKARLALEEAERLRVAEEQRLAKIELDRQAAELAEKQRIEREKLEAERRELAELRAEQERIRKIEQDRIDAVNAENLRVQKEAQAKLDADRAEHERQMAVARQEAETARIHRENELEQQRQKLEAERMEVEQERRRQKEEADALETARLQREHEEETAEANRIASQLELDAKSVLDPYKEFKPAKTIFPWHYDAAETINERINAGLAIGMNEIAKIIADFDPQNS